MTPDEFSKWFSAFLPDVGSLKPAVVTDPTDGKLAHLDGLNLSRAWMMEGIASALPAKSALRATVERTAKAHKGSGLAAVTGAHYEGGHWLGSFATYLVTQRGIAPPPAASKE